MTDQLSVEARMRDELSRPLKTVESQADRTGQALRRMGGGSGAGSAEAGLTKVQKRLDSIDKAFTGFLIRWGKRGALALGAATAAGATFGIKTAASFQQSTVAFGTLLGSAEKGKQLFDDLFKLTFRAPFTLPQLTEATQTLLNFGFAGDEVVGKLKAILDIAATSSDPSGNLSRIAIAVGQIREAGVARGQDLNQLVQAGVPAYDLLAQSIGKTTQQTRKLMEAGSIPAGPFLELLFGLKGPLANRAGGAERMMATINGQVTNLKDNFIGLAVTGAQPAIGFLTKELPKVNKYLSDVRERIVKLGPEMSRQFKAGDLHGLAGSLDTVLGLHGKGAGVIEDFLRIGRDFGRVVKNDLLPAAQDILHVALPALHGLADTADFLGNHAGIVKLGAEAFIAWYGARKVVGVVQGLATAFGALKAAQAGGWLAALLKTMGWTGVPGVPGTGGPIGKGTPGGVGVPPVGVPGAGGMPPWLLPLIGGVAFSSANVQQHKGESLPRRIGHDLLPFAPGANMPKASDYRGATLWLKRGVGSKEYEASFLRAVRAEAPKGTTVEQRGSELVLNNHGDIVIHAKDFDDFARQMRDYIKKHGERG